jgi:hypothetical protein
MKSHWFILQGLTSAIVLVTGCQSESHQEAAPSSASPSATASSPAPQVARQSASTKPLPPVIRIKAGGPALKDSAGIEWLGDTGFNGGDVIARPDLQIDNTSQPEIYRSEHYSMDSFTHKLPNGKYQVKLHFCETYEGITGPGQRMFTFDVQGKTFKNFDVWVKAGGFARPYLEAVPVDITDGQLIIKFTPQMENPQINAIEIIPVR